MREYHVADINPSDVIEELMSGTPEALHQATSFVFKHINIADIIANNIITVRNLKSSDPVIRMAAKYDLLSLIFRAADVTVPGDTLRLVSAITLHLEFRENP